MKKYIYLISAMLLTGFLTSCDDMYDVHQKYLDEGEDTYIGMASNVESYGGFERIKLVWKINTDPKIDACHIYWNNRQDSLIVPPDRSDTVMQQIIPLPEGKYQIEIVNKSNSGTKSLTASTSAESYGDHYKERLYQRIITMDPSPKQLTMKWSLEERCVGSNFYYTTKDGEKKHIFMDADETSLALTDYVPGAEFQYNTSYIPEKNAIDTITLDLATGTFSDPSYYILSKEDWDKDYKENYLQLDRSAWTVTANTEELVGETAPSGPIAAIFDGNPNTFWHTQWNNSARPPLPHQIDIDMKEVKIISSVEVARRSGNKDTKKVVLSMSKDGQEWTDMGALEYPNNNNPNSKILFYPNGKMEGRYVRILVTESNNGVNASLSEVTFTTFK